jgi:hypothetical protein
MTEVRTAAWTGWGIGGRCLRGMILFGVVVVGRRVRRVRISRR